MNKEITPTYQRRVAKSQQRMEFNVQHSVVTEGPFADIISLQGYFGLAKNERITLTPAFDEIVLSDDGSVAFCLIADMWTLFDSASGNEVMEKSMISLPTFHSAYLTLEFTSSDGMHGLYDLNSHRLMLDALYDEVDPCAAYSHLWVRKGDQWGFVNIATGKLTMTPETQRAYEAENGLFVRYNNSIVCCNEDGIADPIALRIFVLNNGGRGIVRNDKYHETVYFDIYGNIL